MNEIPTSKFKATCMAVLEGVHTTGVPVPVTRYGKTVAEIVAPRRRKPRRRKLGQMAGTGRILGDLIEPAFAESDWNALPD